MELNNFLSSLATHDQRVLITSYNVPDKVRSDIFLSHIRSIVASRVPIEPIALHEVDITTVFARLSTTFLGQTQTFWLYGAQHVDKRYLKDLEQFLAQYKGPHQLFAEFVLPYGDVVDIPDVIDRALFARLYEMRYGQTVSKLFMDQLFKQVGHVSLEECFRIMDYARLLGAQSKDFFKDILPLVQHKEHSLYHLAQHLFSGQQAQFFAVWYSLKDHYSYQFWCAYWSEQFFKAIGYMYYAQQGQFALAKKFGYRLPFAFMQKDWKRHDIGKCIRAHKYMTAIDWHAKNSVEGYLELVYIKFFKD